MSRRARIAVAVLAVLHGGVLLGSSLARWSTFHDRTFDLAFYARLAWGLVRGHTWEPMVGAHVFGLHLSPVLVPLGALGALFGTVPVLLAAQAVLVAAAAFPLPRFGARRAGDAGAILGAAAFVLYPNLGHVAPESFHPGTVAVLPLAWAIDALDRRDARALAWSVAGVLACREDLALVSVAWLAVYLAVLLPIFGPRVGSFDLHFGPLVSHPEAFFAHLARPERISYLLRVLLPLALLPLARPRWLLVAAPVLALNFLSAFPSTAELGSHYLSPAIPALVAGAIDGAVRIGRRAGLGILAVGVGVACFLAGGLPFSRDFPAGELVADARTHAARRVRRAIPDEVSVQAPGWFLAHVAERDLVFLGPPPDREAAFVVLDVSHRRRYARQETLLRTREEPIARRWLARGDHALALATGDLLLLRRGGRPREGVGGRAIRGRAPSSSGVSLSACLALLGARASGDRVAIDFVARGPCPGDVGLRIGSDEKPRRVDLLFGGLLSPVHLREGDLVRSVHEVDLGGRALRVGLLRSGGARIERTDPISVDVPIGR